MENNSVQQSLKLFIVLSRAHRSINDVVNKYIAEQGLNPTEFAVLELLYHKGEQPLQQIGGKILLASGSITYVVDKLEKKQYIEKSPVKKIGELPMQRLPKKEKRLLKRCFQNMRNKLMTL